MRRCWTCNTEHNLDEPCAKSPMSRAHVAAGGSPFMTSTDTEHWTLGPIFTATYESDDSCCGEGIVPGEDIRSDGHGGWIHADDQCERLARS